MVKTASQQTNDNTDQMQSVYLPEFDLTKLYPKLLSDSEIDYDIDVNVRGFSPEEYFTERQPQKELIKQFNNIEPVLRYNPKSAESFMKGLSAIESASQQGLKAAFVNPLGAVYPEKLTDEQISDTYKPWADLWEKKFAGVHNFNMNLADTRGKAAAFIPWFLTEYIPSEILEFISSPSKAAVGSAVSKVAPVAINKAISMLPAKVRETLLRDLINGESQLSNEFDSLGLKPNAKTSSVVKSYRSKALETHPDRGGTKGEFESINEAYTNIMNYRKQAYDKILDIFRSTQGEQVASTMKPSMSRISGLLANESGQVPMPSSGDVIKTAKGVAKFINMSAETVVVNLAGKTVNLSIDDVPQLKPMAEQYKQADKAINAINQLGSINDKNEVVIDDVAVKTSANFGRIVIDDIYKMDISKKGQASPVLNKITKIADEYGVPIYLQASATKQRVGDLKKSQLIGLYEKHGFTQISEDSDEMVRIPVGGEYASRVGKETKEGSKQAQGMEQGKESSIRIRDDEKNGMEVKELTAKEIVGTRPEGLVTENESAVNLEHIKAGEEAKQALNEGTKLISDEIQNQTGKPLSHEEVINVAKESEILKGGVSREQTLKFEAALLRTRQHLAALAEQKELTKEFLDTLRIVANTGTDIARQLESFKIDAMPEYATIKTKIIKDLIKLGKSSEEILEAGKNVDFKNQKEVAEFYRKFVKAPLVDQLDEFAYINILSSPKTHIVNAFSNIIQLAGLNPLTKLATGAVDMIAANLTGSARQTYLSEIPDFYKGAINAIPKAVDAWNNALAGNAFVERPDVKYLPTLAPWIDYATLGLGKYVTRALEGSDVFFRTLLYEGEKNALMQRYTSAPTDKEVLAIEKEAARRAEYYVFRQPLDPSNKTGQGDVLSAIDNMTSAVYNFRNAPGVRWFVRFVRTPANILKQGIEYSPAGISTIKGAKNKKEQIGKTIIGSTVFAIGYWVAMAGRSTWSLPQGKKERDMFYASGRVPYSVKIGDKWVSYSKLGPLAYPLAMSSALYYYEKEASTATSDDVLDKATRALEGIMQFFSDQSYVQSLGDLVKTLQGDRGAVSRLATNIPSQMIPLTSLQSWVNSLIDPLYRKPETGFNTKAVADNLLKHIIGGSLLLPSQKDIYGQPAKNENRIVNAVSPLKIGSAKQDGEQLLQTYREGRRIKAKMKKESEKILNEAKQ